ncbi:MAG TPA: VanW family protein [Candidatus Alectryocaccobium stercorigallinarum]|nr:VanW family protein [Candidatus Alectryocaccobium stercorigallinarum]
MTLKTELKRILLPVLSFFAALFVLCVYGAQDVKATQENVAADNIYIENICVAGMNEDEINAVIQQKMTEYSSALITVNVGSQSVDITAGELGLYQTNTDITAKILSIGKTGNIWKRYTVNKDLEAGEQVIFEIDMAVSEEAVRAVVQQKGIPLNIQRVDMSLTMGSDGLIYPTGKQDGVYVNEDEAVAAICEYMDNDWFGGYGEINLPITIDTAYGDEAQFSQSNSLLGSGTTSFEGSTRGRAVNIGVATSRINGTVLLPGEEFSSLEKMMPFNAETGYEPATSIELGEYVETYGGGACQVSTTLYRAVLESELEVTERYAHSLSVGYVDPSLDAAVAEGVKDFKFKNNTDYPIYIEGYISGETVTFNIYGCETRDPGRSLEFVGEVIGETEIETVYELDDSIPVGYYSESAGNTGTEAEAIKIVYQDGAEVSRETINYSKYNAQDHVVSIGTGGASDSQLAEIQAAVATQDMEQISAATGGLTLV